MDAKKSTEHTVERQFHCVVSHFWPEPSSNLDKYSIGLVVPPSHVRSSAHSTCTVQASISKVMSLTEFGNARTGRDIGASFKAFINGVPSSI